MKSEVEHPLYFERQKFLEDLKINVQKAFENRVKVGLLDGIPDTHQHDDLADQNKLDHNRPSVVYVANPHDYRDLLIMSLNTIGYPKESVIEMANKKLRHELEHTSVLIGHTLVDEIQYSVEFFEAGESENRVFSVLPFFSISDKVPLWLYKKSLEATSTHSKSDLRRIQRLNEMSLWAKAKDRILPHH